MFDTEEGLLKARDHLAAGSAVARALPGFRPREEQQAMAAAVEAAILEGRHLVAEAGTGVGKSFAYLVPALLHAARGGGPVVVATRTIALQEQLTEKDLPFLLEALNLPDLPVALAKGRGQYVCLRRLEAARAERKSLFSSPGLGEELERLAEWAHGSEDGSLSDLPFRPSAEVWDAARAEQGNCLHKRCAFYARCGYQRSRHRIRTARLIVANHALVLTDLALREVAAGFLPDYEVLVIDEAHELEEGAGNYFGTQVSQLALTRQLNRLTGSRGKGGLFERIEAPRRLWDLVEEVRGAAKDLFSAACRLRGAAKERRLAEPGEFPDPLTRPLAAVVAGLREAQSEIADPGLNLEWKARTDRLEEMAASLERIHGLLDRDLVYWIESAGRRAEAVLRAAPVEVAPILKRGLFSRVPCVVLTSATLRVGKSFAHFCERIGLEEPEEAALGSPFDFERQCRLVLYPQNPDPRSPAYGEAVVRCVRDLVLETGGGAFVLFTSYRALEQAHDALHEELDAAGLSILRQSAGLRTRDIVSAFRERRDCVLFATDTFWQGIDVAGDHLRLVVLTKLPFAVPDHPLQQARLERIQDLGGDPFRQLSLPQAVLRLRQGFGRLIRKHDDKGVVAILDPRICSRGYGRVFLDSLPRCGVEERG